MSVIITSVQHSSLATAAELSCVPFAFVEQQEYVEEVEEEEQRVVFFFWYHSSSFKCGQTYYVSNYGG